MNRRIFFLILAALICGTGTTELRGANASLHDTAYALPQEHVIDGPEEGRSDARELDLDQDDFQSAEAANPQDRKKIEFFLGIGFLLAVILIAFFLRGRKSS